MKILITGANGYIGQGVVKKLLDKGHEIIATDLGLDHVDSRAKGIVANIFDENITYDSFDRPEVVLHLAWRNGFLHNDISHINDLPLHYAFIKKMVTGGAKQISVLGTMHEVGFFEGSINENTPTNPLSLYGISKDALRKMTFLLCDGCDVISQWIRGYYIVGNAELGSSIFSKILKAANEEKTEFPFTMGQNQWDFLDYDDFCDQVAAIVSQNRINGIINACSGYPEKLSTRVERFIKDNHLNISLQYGAYPDRPYDSKAVWGDNRKVMEIIENEKSD
jgi:dTDP-6-deoxy-L-talose 4-dehydrogenase (NAD+)